MRFVVDASVAIKWLVAETDSKRADRLLLHELCAPGFLYLECANALWRFVRRGEATVEQAREKLRALHRLDISQVPQSDLVHRALKIACTLDHPTYDCLYLAAAERENARVVTADTRLLNKLAASTLDHLALSLQTAAAN